MLIGMIATPYAGGYGSTLEGDLGLISIEWTLASLVISVPLAFDGLSP